MYEIAEDGFVLEDSDVSANLLALFASILSCLLKDSSLRRLGIRLRDTILTKGKLVPN